MQINPFSHLALKACTLSCSYALQDHYVLLKTRLEMKWAKLTGDRKKYWVFLFLLLVHDSCPHWTSLSNSPYLMKNYVLSMLHDPIRLIFSRSESDWANSFVFLDIFTSNLTSCKINVSEMSFCSLLRSITILFSKNKLVNFN